MAHRCLPLRPAFGLWLVYAGCALASMCGCASIRVERVSSSDLFEGWRASAVRPCSLSPRSEQTLRRLALDQEYEQSPDRAVARLHAEAVRDPQPESLFTLAEISYLLGQKAEKHSDKDAITHYYHCAGYAYHFIFDKPPTPPPDLQPSVQTADFRGRESCPLNVQASIFDPRFRLACDLYNAAVAKCILAAQRVGQLDARQQLQVPTGRGPNFTLSVRHVGFPGQTQEFGKLLLCEDYQVVGLDNQYRSYGLGVPLIANTHPQAVKDPHSYSPPTSSPVTAFLRFEGSLADLGECRSGQLELYNPLTLQAVNVNGRVVPLETDLTTPLGYYLAHSDLEDYYTGFVWGDKIRQRTGVHMLTPYQPGKIPVVLVHGLLSAPVTWAPVFNDLQADPTLRERFQFWYYYYPTGVPYLATAAQLRTQLEQLRQELDPEHKDAALDQMVFVGHSMGGLVSRLMTVDSDDKFWRLVSDQPFDRLHLQPQSRTELQQTFFFRPESCVKRVIFCATPHHGSDISPSPLGRLAVHLVRFPRAFMTATQDLVRENADLATMLHMRTVPTSIDLLAPKSPVLELLSNRPRPPAVHYHSIIGVVHSNAVKVERWLTHEGDEPTDGVVPYSSAHLDDNLAESEVVVPADHCHVHHHPLAILEIRRILLEHYQEVTHGADGQSGIRLLSNTEKNPAAVHPQANQPKDQQDAR
jgi:pimeloyl-ACP methyl ester carboxylesterase